MKRVGELYRENLSRRVREGVGDHETVFVMSYSHLSASQLNDFRKDLKQAGAQVFVSKNSLARLALRDLKFNTLSEGVQGQTAFVWGDADSVEISKILAKFLKECEKVQICGGLLSGRILGAEDVQKLAELPSREVLLSILFAAIQAPLTRLAGALNAKTRDLISILKQLSEKK